MEEATGLYRGDVGMAREGERDWVLRQSAFAKASARQPSPLRMDTVAPGLPSRSCEAAKAGAPGRQSPISLTIRIYGDFSHGLLPIPAEIPAS